MTTLERNTAMTKKDEYNQTKDDHIQNKEFSRYLGDSHRNDDYTSTEGEYINKDDHIRKSNFAGKEDDYFDRRDSRSEKSTDLIEKEDDYENIFDFEYVFSRLNEYTGLESGN